MPFPRHMQQVLNSRAGPGRIIESSSLTLAGERTYSTTAAPPSTPRSRRREPRREIEASPDTRRTRCRPEQQRLSLGTPMAPGHEWHIEDGKFGLQSDPRESPCLFRSRHTSLAATSLTCRRLTGYICHKGSQNASTRRNADLPSIQSGAARLYFRVLVSKFPLCRSRQDTYEGCFRV